MSSNIEKVLVTGASGFLGSVIIDELLAAGYKVRGTARSGKAPRVQAAYASFGDRFEIVVVDDLATSDLSHALAGVDALIHVGSPLAGKATPEVLIKAYTENEQSAVDGTLRVLEAALKAGVTKIVVTASIMSLASPARIHSSAIIGASDWCDDTLERAAAAGDMDLYGVSKTLAEKALWKFASEHPELDVATIHPGYLFGAPGRGQVLDQPADGTNGFIYQLISGPAGRPVPEQTPAAATHVRDAALLHVLALKAAPSPASKPKRIVAVGPDGHFTWVEAVQWLYETRPELRSRLPTVTGKETHSLDDWCRWDASSAKDIAGLEKFRGWKEMVGDAIDGILKKEKELGVVIVQ
ncbi:NAD(P)-binding protein [Dentipellis sp. KUC8613]|nr:NAD(P)-binding protein [Dentipellis sp. KUC8613]